MVNDNEFMELVTFDNNNKIIFEQYNNDHSTTTDTKTDDDDLDKTKSINLNLSNLTVNSIK